MISASRNINVGGQDHGWINEPPAPTDLDAMSLGALRARSVEITLGGGGALADIELVPAVPGYFGVLVINKMISGFTDPNVTFAFQDEDNNRLQGAPIDYVVGFTVSQTNDDLVGLCLYIAAKTAAKALEVDVTNGAIGGVLVLHISYFYERA